MSTVSGRIREILRIPIKSFQGEAVEATTLLESGIFADRAFALRDKESGKILSGKHAQKGERLLELSACFTREPVVGEALPPILATIDGEECSTEDLAAFTRRCADALDAEVELVAAGEAGHVYDTYWPQVEGLPLSDATIEFPLAMAEVGSFADLEPLHLLATSSIAHLASLLPGSEITEARFRPSVVIDTGDATGFVENDWVGRTASLGGAKLELGLAAPRCVMTTRPQRGLPKDIRVLRTLVQENRQEFMGMQMPCLGIYAKVTQPGPISLGDELRIE